MYARIPARDIDGPVVMSRIRKSNHSFSSLKSLSRFFTCPLALVFSKSPILQYLYWILYYKSPYKLDPNPSVSFTI